MDIQEIGKIQRQCLESDLIHTIDAINENEVKFHFAELLDYILLSTHAP